jgi:hypothetical protein
MAHLEVRSTCDSSFPKDTPISTQSGTCGDTKFEVLMFEAPTDKPWYHSILMIILNFNHLEQEQYLLVYHFII